MAQAIIGRKITKSELHVSYFTLIGGTKPARETRGDIFQSGDICVLFGDGRVILSAIVPNGAHKDVVIGQRHVSKLFSSSSSLTGVVFVIKHKNDVFLAKVR